MMNSEKIKQLIELDKEIEEMSTQLDLAKEQRKHLEPVVMEELANAGIDKMSMNGRTAFIRTDIYAKKLTKDDDEIRAALILSDMKDYIQPKFKMNSISGYLREILAEGKELPKPLAKVIGINEKLSVRTVKS